MHIKKLYATFGKLSNETLTLSRGLNVIYGKNESGKSTWSAFIRAMFYGIATREQKKGGFLPDKEKYLPHNGSPMYGKMELSEKDGEMTIERTSPRSGVMTKVSARYDETGKDAPEGEALVGVSKSVYERTAFIRQSGLSVTRDDDTEKRILSLASSGDETISATEVIARLKKRQRLLRSVAKSGEIPKLEGEIFALREKIAEEKANQEELAAISEKLSELRKRESALARAYEIAKAEEEKNKRGYIATAKEAFAKASETLRAVENYPMRREVDLFSRKKNDWSMALVQKEQNEKLSAMLREEVALCKERLSSSPFAGMSENDARTSSAKDITESEKASKKKRLTPAVVAFFAVAVIFAALSVVLGVAFFLLAVIFFVSAVILKVSSKKKGPSPLLKKYGTEDEAEIKKLLDEYITNLNRADELSKKLRLQEEETSKYASAAALGAEDLTNIAKGFLSEVEDFDEVERKLLALVAEREAASAEEASARAKVEALSAASDVSENSIDYDESEIPSESPSEIEEQLRSVSEEKRRFEISHAALTAAGAGFLIDVAEAELCRLEKELVRTEGEYGALSLAIDTIDEAETELKNRFSPEIEKRTSEIFKYLSGGNYKIVRIKNNEFEMDVAEGLATSPYEHLTLSQGTIDELYLALRIALFETVVPQENAVPLVLDDAMVNFDDERMKRTLDLLYEKSNTRQIIIFSCHEREAEYLREKTDVNIIKL